MTLHYVSLFSGIEAFSVAASRIRDVNWRPVFFSEIDPFASAVLQHHFPDVPNLGDITQITIDPETRTASNHDTTIPLPRTGIDILAGGSPCQGFSVAGKRLGARDPRSALAFEYARLVRALRPRVLLWENVPGVLSSNGGRDFGAFLRSLAELGYGLAWRVLDVQHARVDSFPGATPQRRRRVWLVGCLGGDGRVPAQILFERPGLLGDTPPRREAGKGFAAPAGYGPARNDRVVEVARACGNGQLNQSEPEIVAKTLDTMHDAQMVVASASFDGADVSPTLHRPNGAPGYSDQEVFAQQGSYLARCAAPTLQSRMGTGGNQVPLVQIEPSVCKTLSAEGFDGMPDPAKGNGQQVVAVRTANTHANGHGVAEECSHTCDRAQGQAVAIGFSHVASGVMSDCKPDANAIPLKSHGGGEGACVVGFESHNQTISPEVMHTHHHHDGLDNQTKAILRYIVRRLTPGECETLQAFPQGWTRIPWRTYQEANRKGMSYERLLAERGMRLREPTTEECPDSPRYKALGNSWGTNCAEWILRRIVAAFRLGMI